MHMVGYRAVKSPECVKKSKITHNFFMTKATDLYIDSYHPAFIGLKGL